MNSSNTALQSGHHHHHHQPASTAGVNQQFQHSSTPQVHQKINPAVVNPNPSVHQFQTLNDPWQLQTQFQQHIQGANTGPIPPLRLHKKSAPLPPAAVSTSLSKPALQHLTVTSTYNNQPVYLTNSAQTQTTPGLAPQSVLHSPKSPNQNFAHPSANLMSSSLTGGNFTSSTSMVNNHQTSHHHPTSSLSNSNNNNNNNFDDLNVNGSSSFGSSTSNQKKVDLKHNTMP